MDANETSEAAWLFASDLHGQASRWLSLIRIIEAETPAVVLLGGDLLPNMTAWSATIRPGHEDFLNDFVAPRLRGLREALGARYPRLLAILGNDDPRSEESSMLAIGAEGLWEYVQERRVQVGDYDVYGYCRVPPTPFLLKDWERYDVSRFVDPGCVSPEEGWRTVPVRHDESRLATIQDDLQRLTEGRDLRDAIMLFHVPPHGTVLDRAALDQVRVDHAPVDVHIGSIAVRRLIEERQPRITLHGHVHEAARLTGAWSAQLGRTWCFNAAHDGPELALVRFDPARPEAATRTLLGISLPPPLCP